MTTGFGNVTIDLSRAPIAQAEDTSAIGTGEGQAERSSAIGTGRRAPARLRAEPQGVRYTGVRALAEELGVKAGHLSMILHGRRPAGKRIRDALRARGVNVMGWREWERAHGGPAGDQADGQAGQADGQAERSSAIRTGGAMAQR